MAILSAHLTDANRFGIRSTNPTGIDVVNMNFVLTAAEVITPAAIDDIIHLADFPDSYWLFRSIIGSAFISLGEIDTGAVFDVDWVVYNKTTEAIVYTLKAGLLEDTNHICDLTALTPLTDFLLDVGGYGLGLQIDAVGTGAVAADPTVRFGLIGTRQFFDTPPSAVSL